LRDTLIPCAIATNAVATQGFTEAEQHQLRDFLRRMIASLADAPAMQQERSE